MKNIKLPIGIEDCKYNLKGESSGFHNAIQKFYSKCVYEPYIYDGNTYQLHSLEEGMKSNIMIRYSHEIGVYRDFYTNENQSLGRLISISVLNKEGLEVYNSLNKLIDFNELNKYVINTINIFEKLYTDFCVMYYGLSNYDMSILTAKNIEMIEMLKKDGEFYHFLKYRKL